MNCLAIICINFDLVAKCPNPKCRRRLIDIEVGILIGLLGIAGIAGAYPVYRMITRKRRKKLAPEILRLTNELMK